MASQDIQSRARRGSRVSGGRELKMPPTYTVDGRTYTAGPEMRPRSHTVSVEANRRPLNLPSSPGRRPVVTTIKPRTQTRYPSPTRDSGERYIFPSSSHSRHRQSSGAAGGDSDTLLLPGDREIKYRNGYLAPANNSGYPSPSRDSNYKDIDVRDSFSYTNAREQFYRDSDAIRESRRQAPPTRKSRPLSLTGLEAYLPQITRDPKASGPPPSSQGFPGTKKEDAPRTYKEIKPRDVDTSNINKNTSKPRTSDSPRRSSTHRTPVSLHQDRTPSPAPRRSGYDDTREKGYQIRRDANNIVVVDDKPEPPRRDPRRSVSGQVPGRERGYSNTQTPDGMMSGGLATAGLASGYSKEPVEISPRPDARNGRDHTDYPSRVEDRYKPSSKNWSHQVDDGYHSDGAREKYRYKSSPPREPERRPRDPSPAESDTRRPINSPRHDDFVEVAPREPNPSSAKKPSPPPAKTSPEAQAPKGILKQPTEKFPEEPHAVREGVAPLKDAQKKGVPAGARWTKIDRRLVSPSALEGRERFEERPDYVIVLRVLSREEIEQYAVASAKIRAAARNRRNSDRRSRDEDESRSRGRGFDSDGDEERPSQLRIEPPRR
ncbi:hypothetical protein McanMca71_002913 [Microsporum canis]|uniref:DUF8035 domain-containing protein n=1 Tax=Arthroderma otae (strain ATCC MYA-4605 / CBS 113480) TaxID=554155 RepID=C5FVF4_ARTOC|nr:conserved hypothetical protein [Microsporum canis CBS 113480]EEQ33888.1 conserved hypothetical protein [Microsporum canis CBS 113480]